MKTRVLFGLPAAALVVALLYLGPIPLVLFVILLCAVLAYLEYDRLFFNPSRGVPRQIRQAVLIFFTIIAMEQSATAGWVALWVSSMVLFIRHVLAPSRSGDFPKAVYDVSMELLGYWYIVGLFGFLLPLILVGSPERDYLMGRNYLMLLFMIVFAGDTAAYFVGSRIGKHSLAERVSPKKTVEGAIAAGVAAVVVSYIWLKWLAPTAQLPLSSNFTVKVLCFAPFGSALAQFGDLFESVLKRSRSRKDSGAFLPGHGGILDRVDGLALSAPIFYFYIKFILERV